MAKIIIPDRKIQAPRLEVEVSEEELILILNSQRLESDGKIKSALLGVFKGLTILSARGKYEDLDKTYLRLSNAYVLYPCGRIGNLDLPCLERKGDLKLCKNTNLKEIYSPQSEIIKQLKSWPGFGPHSEWVARLTKPY
jgi:hypothetical protein